MGALKGNTQNSRKDFLLNNLQFVSSFQSEYDFRKSKLPYHVNLVDELGADENAHSRILVRLLGFNKEGQYPVLIHFLAFLKKKIQDFNFLHQVTKPIITAEMHRIDALITEEDYAIIIENKIHYAEDQHEQLLRYIDKVRSLFINDENIYIFYITGDGGTPNENSLPLHVIEEFKGRYLELSFKYDILCWLQELKGSSFVTNHEMLHSAIMQYTDHLKGFFDLRENEQTMKDELLKFLETQLGLSTGLEDFQEQMEILQNKMGQLDHTRKHLDALLRKKAIDYWKNRLESDFEEKNREQLLFFKCDNIQSYPKMGIIHKYKKQRFIIIIGIDTRPYYGIMCDLNSRQTIPEICDWLADEIMELPSKLTGWYGFKYTEYSETYECFKGLAQRIITKAPNK